MSRVVGGFDSKQGIICLGALQRKYAVDLAHDQNRLHAQRIIGSRVTHRRRVASGFWNGESGETMADASRKTYAANAVHVNASTITAIVWWTVRR
jgi:hypothetical protein